jgi:hypothetical protein
MNIRSTVLELLHADRQGEANRLILQLLLANSSLKVVS